jgi:two-component system, OmpR family, sensor histidine kinase MprB
VQKVRLDEIVEEAVERTRRRAPGLAFDTELEPTTIENVPERVARAVTNVLDNARKWSPDRATVQVTLSGGAVTVRDHGPGFGEEDLPHVFERFYRAGSARRMPGSGLSASGRSCRLAANHGSGRLSRGRRLPGFGLDRT